uniref:ATP synthase subunit a n=1 Tax=Zancudomyces culisetae TaxID=1213189 RepID=ATP6_ZANCU|nr:ATP synthase F0 subunit 6 [Zancudomyces culisetae]Q3T4C2.1 RecName: Full=ATP synthase subunit a; AltName: Full=ATP synthase subunit 6; AltName: Full=F-ATPase protein 6; Flags: Precursor [Zancudomyces culisetae]AAW49492.1 ATP synthase F0 subunit 6 [Zancudomyces culisetae]
MLYNPLEQFTVNKIISLYTVYYSMSLTNSSLYFIIAAIISFFIFKYSANIPYVSLINKNNYSILTESLYKTILKMVKEQIGDKYTIYMPLIFSLFIIILVSNLVGLIPYGFSPTALFALPLGLSVTIIISVTVIGFVKYHLKYFSVLLPSGTPLGLVPLLLVVELLSYIARAFSLGIRLAANITSGHILLNIISGFLFKTSGIALLFVIIPFTLFIALTGLELIVAILQAYVWSILTCIYIKDSLILH